jgi:hypothetical protein
MKEVSGADSMGVSPTASSGSIARQLAKNSSFPCWGRGRSLLPLPWTADELQQVCRKKWELGVASVLTSRDCCKSKCSIAENEVCYCVQEGMYDQPNLPAPMGYELISRFFAVNGEIGRRWRYISFYERYLFDCECFYWN